MSDESKSDRDRQIIFGRYMNNLACSQQTYLQSDTSQQLNSLADRLEQLAVCASNRIATICNDGENLSSVVELIRESQYLIEWTAPTLSIDDVVKLVDLGRILAEWKYRWTEISGNPANVLKVRNLAQSWHECLCKEFTL